MSKKLRLVQFDELKSIRLVCRTKKCHTVVEFDLARFISQEGPSMKEGPSINDARCPGCNEMFAKGGGENPLRKFAEVLDKLRTQLDGRFFIQFPTDEAEGLGQSP